MRPLVKLTLMGESSLTIPESHEDHPTGYYEAINDKDFGFWKEAMKSELESMYSNNVWTLVDLPQGVKPIGCKWVYKRKKEVDGKVEIYKPDRWQKVIVKNQVLIMRKLFTNGHD